ncbi:MAG: hypothetical protein HQK53_06300 [Oligoflexia bacterium]|nr:hypothetical protein [Oligoflexia bacterium]
MAATTLSAVVLANSTTSVTTIDNFYDRLRASKFGLRLDTETISRVEDDKHNTIDGYATNGYATNLYTALTYALNSDTTFFLYPQLIFTRNYRSVQGGANGGENYKLYDGYLAVRFDQNNILTEAGSGISLAASTRYYARVSSEARYWEQELGNLNLNIYARKQLASNFLLNSEFDLFFVNTDDKYRLEGIDAIARGKERRSTPTYKHDIYFIPEFVVNSEFSTYLQLLHHSQIARSSIAIDSYDEFSIAPGVNYGLGLNSGITLGYQLLTYVSKSHKQYRNNLQSTISLNYLMNTNFKIYLEAIAPMLNDSGALSWRTAKNGFTFELDLSLVAF